MTIEVLKKIGRNVLKGLGIGLEDRMEKVLSLPHNKKRAIKTLQVCTAKFSYSIALFV